MSVDPAVLPEDVEVIVSVIGAAPLRRRHRIVRHVDGFETLPAEVVAALRERAAEAQVELGCW